MIRCKDIAAMVGVSRQAVTAVLNNSHPNYVSKEKRAKILQIAAEHNYRPDHAAVALKTGKSNLIGVVMPPWENLYSAELCMGIQRSLAARNYTPFFAIDNKYNPVPGNLEQLLSLHVAGLITVAAELLPDKIDMPVVSYFHDDPRFDSVCQNPALNSRLIIEHLKKCGHRKIGYLGFPTRIAARHLTLEAKRCGLEFPDRWKVDFGDKPCEDSFDRLLERNRGRDLPTALIIHNDTSALSLMHRIRERGYRIPEDFSIIGHDNIRYCITAVPTLTSMSVGTPDEIAEAMVSLLMERMNDPVRPREKVLLKSELIERDSVLILREK
ncbi:MAG: LacI family DNA-binding transcriptional regulator [Lentisphaeria bacterium]|nr:LacI family DNA-binding transcriptional regulator [Lentisphaeria bacterium]